MDPRTFQRAQQGDLDALRSVERHLKGVARAVLAHPAMGVGDPVTQRVLTNAAVAEALERDLGQADTLLAATVMAASRRAVEFLHRSQPGDAAIGHLPPGILVSVALVPQVLASISREAAERHLGACALCTDMARRVRESAATVVAEVEDPQGGESAHAADGTEAEPVEVEQDAEEGSSLDVESLMRRLVSHEGARGVTAGPRPSRRRGRSLDPRRQPGRAGEPQLRAAPLVAFALALIALVGWAGRGCWDRASPPRIEPGLAKEAVLDLPSLPDLRTAPAPLEPGLRDLSGGSCSLAARRFHLARLRDPALATAWYWEGLAGLCAREGGVAVEALLGAQQRAPELEDLDWYLAQAALLEGQVDLAIASLARSCGGGQGRARDACGQYARVMGR